MVLRLILKYLVNNEHLINKLADSRPIRKAAQFVVYVFHRTRAQQMSKNPTDILGQLTSFIQRSKIKFKEEIEQAKEDLKRKQSK